MLIRIYPENPNPREMAKALKMLRDGELIIYPTDTVYTIRCPERTGGGEDLYAEGGEPSKEQLVDYLL